MFEKQNKKTLLKQIKKNKHKKIQLNKIISGLPRRILFYHQRQFIRQCPLIGLNGAPVSQI
jgi:hypothetical protein